MTRKKEFIIYCMLILVLILYIFNTNYFITKEKFMSKKRKEWLEPRMCYGWFFRIKIPFFRINMKFCIPGLVIPIPMFSGRSSGSDGYYDCDGTDVCEFSF